MARNIPPGLKRSFAFEKWQKFDSRYIRKEREKAQAEILNNKIKCCYASDIEPEMVSMAKRHAKEQGYMTTLNSVVAICADSCAAEKR